MVRGTAWKTRCVTERAVAVEDIKRLREIRYVRDDEGNVLTQKGTTCDLVGAEAASRIRKQWHLPDWLFSADYGYRMEKHIYQQGNAAGMMIPRLIEFDDATRTLELQYIYGRPATESSSATGYLPSVLAFLDGFRELSLPEDIVPEDIEGAVLRSYRREQLQYLCEDPVVRDEFHTLYERTLSSDSRVLVPYDRVLHNAFLTDNGLVFYDFEWSIAAPFEFALARAAVECEAYHSDGIWGRICSPNAFYLFLIRFYLYGNEPTAILQYLLTQAMEDPLSHLLEMARRITHENEHATG
jgi:hypothetical protein